mmetsp:Transcript_24562/g.58398  ORF Transcript_24562/g.58398 Transcript_24562/m.58398 type:complete len:223 (+) Transcript_24562:651-1319(+)
MLQLLDCFQALVLRCACSCLNVSCVTAQPARPCQVVHKLTGQSFDMQGRAHCFPKQLIRRRCLPFVFRRFGDRFNPDQRLCRVLCGGATVLWRNSRSFHRWHCPFWCFFPLGLLLLLLCFCTARKILSVKLLAEIFTVTPVIKPIQPGILLSPSLQLISCTISATSKTLSSTPSNRRFWFGIMSGTALKLRIRALWLRGPVGRLNSCSMLAIKLLRTSCPLA